MRIAILTVSDAGARGERADTSGDAVAAWATARGHTVVARELVPDESVAIVQRLLAWCDGDAAELVLTTGGTGLSARDITPEATAAVIEREATGLVERIRVSTLEPFPRAALSRAMAGVRHRSLIVNLPGSTSGVRDALAARDPVGAHAVAVLRGAVTEHPMDSADRAAEPNGVPSAGAATS